VCTFESFLYSESPVMNSQRYEHSPLASACWLGVDIARPAPIFTLFIPKGAGSLKISDGDSDHSGTNVVIM